MSSASTSSRNHPPTAEEPLVTKRREWRMFAFIVVLLFPLLSVALVGAYGFSIWMYQLLAGPPAG